MLCEGFLWMIYYIVNPVKYNLISVYSLYREAIPEERNDRDITKTCNKLMFVNLSISP